MYQTWGYQKDLTVIALIWTRRLFTVRSGIVIWAGLSVEIYKVKNVDFEIASVLSAKIEITKKTWLLLL